MNITVHLRAPKFNGHIFSYRTTQLWSPQIDDQDHQFPLLLFEALIHVRPSSSILTSALQPVRIQVFVLNIMGLIVCLIGSYHLPYIDSSIAPLAGILERE